jgi:Acetyl xylan esterase (AXE1)/Secretion system C-terminal sorting domain
VGIVGVSQGGGLAILAAGIDQRISLLVNVFPALCAHPNLKYDKPSGFPSYWHLAPNIGIDQNIVMNTVKYYDAVTAAKRFTGVSWTMVGYRDEICNPATVLEAYNQLKGQKIITHFIQSSHIQTPDAYAKPETPIGMYAFFRQHFPIAKNAPWTWTTKTVGYTIDVGKDIELTNQMSTILRGGIELEYAPINLPMRWEKVEGEGSVLFSNPTESTTRATFSQAGTYRVRLVAEDMSALAADAQFITLSDDLIIKVNAATIPVELTEFAGKKAENSNVLSWKTASENGNKSFDIQRSKAGDIWQGKGNAKASNTYEFTDDIPLSKAYYRLKQTDFSSDFQYSKIIHIDRTEKGGFEVFPNPVSDVLSIKMSDVKPPFTCFLRDELGRVLLAQSSNSPTTSINVTTLATGHYFLEIKCGEGIYIKKIFKVK